MERTNVRRIATGDDWSARDDRKKTEKADLYSQPASTRTISPSRAIWSLVV